MFFRFVKTYIVQMQLDFSYWQFTFIFWKLHLSNAIFLFILKLGAYLTLRTRLVCILFLKFGIPSGYLWCTFVTFGTVFGFNTCLCCIVCCIALCNRHNVQVSLIPYTTFYYSLYLLYVGFNCSCMLVYGSSSSSNSLSLCVWNAQ